MEYTLVNFNMPTKLKKKLDTITKEKHVTRTAILNLLVNQFCNNETILRTHNEFLDWTTEDPSFKHSNYDVLAPMFDSYDYDPFASEEE